MHYINLQSQRKKEVKSLHLFWEFPPFIQGGLAVAGKALCDALSQYRQLDIACPEIFGDQPSTPYPYTMYQIKVPSDIPLNSSYTSNSNEFSLYLKEQMNSFSKGVEMAHFTEYESIHAHDWITTEAAINVQSINKPNHIPLILHIHSTQIDRVGEQSNGAIFNKEKSAIQHADKIVTVSEFTKRTIIKHYGINKDKINVIPNSIAKPLDSTSTLRKKSTQAPTILFAARMEAQKSPLFALEVICATLKKVPQAKAIIAGGGSYLNIMRDLVKFKKMDSRIEVLGHVPHEKMQLVYQVSDVLILPSAAEPFGLVALEAAQLGNAVILSDRCGAAETLSIAPKLSLNSTTSHSDWVNTAVNLLTNHKLRNQQIAKQQTLLNEFSWDDAAKNLLSMLEI